SEDVGMADPTALQSATAAAQAVAQVGMPEARIILAQAVVHIATAPKSNAAYRGIDQAIADVRPVRPALSRYTCAIRTTRGRRTWGRGPTTSTPTTHRMRWPSSSTCPRSWPVAATTGPPIAGTNAP